MGREFGGRAASDAVQMTPPAASGRRETRVQNELNPENRTGAIDGYPPIARFCGASVDVCFGFRIRSSGPGRGVFVGRQRLSATDHLVLKILTLATRAGTSQMGGDEVILCFGVQN